MLVRIVRGQRWIFDERRRLVFPPDPAPYDPCWCYSGKKFRFCHQKRHERADRSLMADFLRHWNERPVLRKCYHPDAPSGCGKIIRAHTVQRSGGGLSALARKGKVYGLRLHPSFLLKQEMRLTPTLVGIGEASTFYGFCADHDSALFRDLETRPFKPTSGQLALLNFRAIARRLYTNEEALEPRFPEVFDQGLSPSQQRWEFANLEDMRADAERALENTRTIKRLNDEVIASGAGMNATVARLVGDAEIACSGLVNIFADFEGNKISPDPPPAHMSFHLLPTAGGATASFVWLGKNRAAEQLCDTLARLELNMLAHAVLRFAIHHVDLVFSSPRWWESLPETDRDAVVDRATASIHPERTPAVQMLLDDGLRVTKLSAVEVEHVGDWM